MLRQPAEGRRERFLEATIWVSNACHASANKLSKVRGLADESIPNALTIGTNETPKSMPGWE